MTKTRILVVEDESIVAVDIQNSLESLGYEVPAVASSGEEAIQKVEGTKPDLVLMDIMLSGEMDGVAAAEYVRARFDIPVVYLTAYADVQTLQRARVTEPFGYILKPFEERDLHTTIEMALYKHQMERRLRQSEQWLATILKSIGDAVIATDIRGCITFMNPMAEGLTSWGQKDALGKKLTEVFKAIDEETRVPIDPLASEPRNEASPVVASNRALLTATQKPELFIEYSATPIREAGGNVSGTVLIFRDVTKQHELQAYLTRSERLRALGTMAGGVAHNFNNLLTSVIGHSQLLQMRTAEQRILHGLRMIEEAAQDGVQMVRRLRNFTETGLNEPFDLIDLNQVVHDAIELTRPLWQQAGQDAGYSVKLETHLGADVTLLGSASELREVLVNLIFNAVEAMSQGGQIIISTGRQENYAIVCVQDTGVGMDKETQEHAFDPFFSTKGSVGVGLGLTQSYSIVERHRGTLGLKSAPGEGTSVTLTFPFATNRPEPTSALASAPEAHPSRLLVVNDQAAIGQVLTAMLTNMGHAVSACYDDSTALAWLERESFDLVFVDLALSTMGGWELVEILKQRWPQIPIVVITGWVGSVKPPLRDVSIDGFIQKPFGYEQLTRVLAGVLGR